MVTPQIHIIEVYQTDPKIKVQPGPLAWSVTQAVARRCLDGFVGARMALDLI